MILVNLRSPLSAKVSIDIPFAILIDVSIE